MGSEEEQEQFGRIVSTFLSVDNEVRAQAEASYDGIPADKKVFFLLALIRNETVPEELRQLCAVLLRRVFVNHFDFAWGQLAEPARKQVKDEIVALISKDRENETMRKKLCELCAELVRSLIDDDGNNSWPDFIQYLFQIVNSPAYQLKENALNIFGLVPSIFGSQQANYLDVIKQMLVNSLASAEYTVRLEAGNAVSRFILENCKEEPIVKHFIDIVPGYLKVLQETIEKESDVILQDAIEIMNEAPKFFRPFLADIFGFLLRVGHNADLEDDMRHLAVEFCITACEVSPGAVKKLGEDFVLCLVQLLLKLMTEQEDNAYWADDDEPVEDDADSNPAVAESGLDRLACGLGGKFVLPLVMKEVHPMLQNEKWNFRYAGLMAISAVGEGCLKQMEQFLPQIVDAALGFLSDVDPRVRYAACNALGQMATDFSPSYEKKYHSKVLPGLTLLLDDQNCARVQAHAGAALVNFCEECPKDILKNYAEALLSKLEGCFHLKLKELAENRKKLVLEQLVTTVAAIANTLETDFAPFYERFMPCMKYIIENANVPELLLLRGKTIECASLIGLAVGADKFTQDASSIMDLLLRTQIDNGGVHIAEDDPQLSYMITAWTRICQILGERFAPYLPMVMGPILRTAAVKPELQVLDSDEAEEIEGQDDWELVKIGESQNLGIHTARLEDKSMACQMLVSYARVMKSQFIPYVDEVIKIIHPLFKFFFHDTVRSSAAEIVPHLLTCLESDRNAQLLLWNHLKAEFFTATEAENEVEVKSEQLYALSCCIEILPREALDHETIIKLTSLVEKVFEEHFVKSAERAETRKDEDYDEVIEEQLWSEMEDDNYLLTKAADITHSLLKVIHQDYLPFMEGKIIPLVVRLISPERHWQERQWGICIWDDLLEFTGPAAAKYQHGFVTPMLNYLGDPSAEVRQAAAYGCGVMAQFAGDIFAQTCKEAWPRLLRIITDGEAKSEDNVVATENAISAAGKIIKYQPNTVNINEAIPMWLSWLPICEDKDEMDSVFGFFCELMESNNPIALGDQGSNLPLIVKIIAEIFSKNALPENSELRPRLIQLLTKIQSNSELFQFCLSHLTPELRQSLQF